MANVSFANLDQVFNIFDSPNVEYGSTSATSSNSYEYLTSGSDKIYISGTSLTDDGTYPTGGTVSRIRIDLDNDGFGTLEVDITGLSFAITDLDIGTGTAEQQRDLFWSTVFGGADTFDLTFANLALDVRLAGDGANINDGALHTGANDTFTGGGSGLTGFVVVAGDYYEVINGTAVGGDDTFDFGGGRVQIGDFVKVHAGATGTGGDDTFTPANLPAGLIYDYFVEGDADVVEGILNGGDDLIDLRTTTVGDFTKTITLIGDAFIIDVGATLNGGNDTIYGSSAADMIYGDDITSFGTTNGGADLLHGEDGADRIYGGGGNDMLFGDGGRDTLDGGAGNDTMYGGAERDKLIGNIGADEMHGGDANDTLTGWDGDDVLYGDDGDDAARGGYGDDTVYGGNGRDKVIGNNGYDLLYGGEHNDTLSGWDEDDLLYGENGNDVLRGGVGNDTLDGGAGDDKIAGNFGDDVLYGGAGNDRFVFYMGENNDTIMDFTAGANTDDVIQLLGFGAAFDTFQEVMDAASQVGLDVVIDFGGGDTITIANTTLANLHQDDFIFG